MLKNLLTYSLPLTHHRVNINAQVTLDIFCLQLTSKRVLAQSSNVPFLPNRNVPLSLR